MKVKPFYPLIAALLLGILVAVGAGFNVFFLVFTVAIVFVFHERIQKSKNRVLILSSLSAVIFFAIFAMIFSPGGGVDPSEPIIINYLLTIPLTATALTLIIYNEFTVTQLIRGGIRTAILSPLTDIPFFFTAIRNLFTRGKTGKSKLTANHVGQAVIAVCSVVVLGLIIVPLLTSADPIFADLMSFDLSWMPNFGETFNRILLALFMSVIFYSLFHSVEARAAEKAPVAVSSGLEIGNIISVSVLGSAIALYLLFIGVQFVYLFAGRGLPSGLTYSEYARQGFFQMIVVCFINLSLFGIFLRFNKLTPALKALLSVLLGATIMILLSSYIRLSLYIGAYGLTFLRLISMWFNVYITVAIAFLYAKLLKRPKLDVFRIAYQATLVWWLIFVVVSAIILP